LNFRWGELESGHTTIAFTPIHQHETDDLTGVVHAANRSKQERPPLEVCFVYPDVDAAYKVCMYICNHIYIELHLYNMLYCFD
jgi:hypothetical protein